MPTLPATEGALPPQGLSADAFSSMFQSIAGLRNLRAAAAMLGCFAVGVLLAGLLGFLGRGSATLLVVAGLAGALLFFTGVHAAGVLLMDQARGLPPRSAMDAVVYGFMCVPKTLALMLLMLLAVIAVGVVVWLLFLICKIPGLGPILFTVVFPACVLLLGITVVALMVSLQIALPALWEGAGVAGALAKAFAILKSRLVETVMLLAVVAVLSGFVAIFVGAVLLFGFLPATGLAATAIGSMGGGYGGGMYGTGGGMLGSVMGGLMQGGIGGYTIAGAIGGGLLWAIALTLVFQVSLLGANLAYLRLSEGIDSSATERAMNARLEQARRKAAEMGQQAKEAAERARAQGERARAQAAQAAQERKAAQAPPAAAAPAAAVALVCPECNGAIASDDVFCGACGHRLK